MKFYHMSIWVDNKTKKITNAWGLEGMVLPILKGLEWNDKTKKLIKKEWLHAYCCCDCNKKLFTIEHSHFAGVYCDDCWKKYKKENSRICQICKQPMYACHC